MRAFFRVGTPLLERNPLLFYKIGFFTIVIVAAVPLGLLLQHVRK